MTDEGRDRSNEPYDDAGDRLPDEAVVVRGGLSTPDTLHMTALAHHDRFGAFAISVRSLTGMTATI